MAVRSRGMETQLVQRADPLPMKLRAASWRIAWIVLAAIALTLIYPWRSIDNAAEVAQAQMLVDSMSSAHDAISSGEANPEEFTIADDGFAGFTSITPGGVPAVGLIGRSGDTCLVMHWTAPGIAQVGRLSPNLGCDPAQIEEVPLRPNAGYVPGTGPPFDVTPLVREAHTPVWFVAALVMLVWLMIRSGLDLFLIFQRPDFFFSKE